jgi:hypothetical protein
MLSTSIVTASLAATTATLTMHHISSCDQCGRPPQGSPGSWCDRKNNTAFEWDGQHIQGPDLGTVGCAVLECNATVFCYKDGVSLYVATDPDVPPCPPTPAPPPPPPPPPTPSGYVWHVPTRSEEGDVNALFQFNGVWHVMSQWAARPKTSVGHAVSTDFLNWARLPDTLASGASGDEQCYDGSASIVKRAGALTPMLMIDGGCGEKGPGGSLCMESYGNGSTGGVTAFPQVRPAGRARASVRASVHVCVGACVHLVQRLPGDVNPMFLFLLPHPNLPPSLLPPPPPPALPTPKDLADPNLTYWKRSAGPTVFIDCQGAGGPSPIIVNPVTGTPELIAIGGGGEVMFQATDETFTAWKHVGKDFLPARGGGGGLWHVLPQLADGCSSSDVTAPWTHVMQLDGNLGDGGATFAMMVVDAASSTVTNLSATYPIDLSNGPRYGQLSTSGGTGKGGGAGDTRTIHTSWLTGADMPDTGTIDNGMLTAFRDLRFDPRVGPAGVGALVQVSVQAQVHGPGDRAGFAVCSHVCCAHASL